MIKGNIGQDFLGKMCVWMRVDGMHSPSNTRATIFGERKKRVLDIGTMSLGS